MIKKILLLNIIIFPPIICDDFKGAVVTNGPECAKIGTDILEKGGTAVDAAIAALFCDGVSVPNCMGLGGGFLMNIYIKESATNTFLVSRETAPAAASKEMFGTDENLARRGGLAVAVPAELKGYREAYKKYGGKVEWKDLIQPTIDLCNNGIPVTDYLEKVYESHSEVIFADEGLREIFIDPSTNSTYKKDQLIKRPKLAKTLQLIADAGIDEDPLYNGSLTKDFIEDIKNKGGIITEEDLLNYEPRWEEPYKFVLTNGETLYATPLPGSGLVLGLILNVLKNFLDLSDPSSIGNWQKIIESFKFGYAKRTELGDSHFVEISDLIANFTSEEYAQNLQKLISLEKTSNDSEFYGATTTQPDDHGTANLCVLAPNGDAVAVTSTINLDFGASFVSGSTGIILNDQMDDFSSPGFTNHYGVPPSLNNYIEPGKRPMSSTNPSIVVDADGNVRLVVGGSGGTKIITSIALTIIRNLWFNDTIEDAVSAGRMHHQLFPMTLFLEDEYFNNADLVTALTNLGHDIENEVSDGFNTVTAISNKDGVISGAFDPRRGGGKSFVTSGTVKRSVLIEKLIRKKSAK